MLIHEEGEKKRECVCGEGEGEKENIPELIYLDEGIENGFTVTAMIEQFNDRESDNEHKGRDIDRE